MQDLYFAVLALQHFHFIRPWWLLLALPLYFILKTLYQRDDSLAPWKKLMSKQMLSTLTVEGNSQRWLSPQKATWTLCALTVVVLAGPTWQQQPSPFTQDKSALVIALDVSQTMKQSDVQPSRLVRAKQKVLTLLEQRGDANTALIAYAGSAHIVMPVTNDREMISHFLDVLDESLIPVQGKQVQRVLPLAEKLLAPTQVPGTLLVIGDGASHETASAFGDYFDQQPHQLIVWAIGDSSKSTVEGSSLIPMQLPQLEAMASQASGRLVLMTHDSQDVTQVQAYINNNLVILDDDATPWYDAGYPLVFVIAGIYLLWFRRGWTLQW